MAPNSIPCSPFVLQFQLLQEGQELRREVDRLVSENERLVSENDRLVSENERLTSENSRLTSENAQLNSIQQLESGTGPVIPVIVVIFYYKFMSRKGPVVG